MLEIDNRLCLQSPENDHCFPDAQSAADYLGALSAVERLDFPYPLRDVRGEAPAGWGGCSPTPWSKPRPRLTPRLLPLPNRGASGAS
jgi:hypothetical protein